MWLPLRLGRDEVKLDGQLQIYENLRLLLSTVRGLGIDSDEVTGLFFESPFLISALPWIRNCLKLMVIDLKSPV